MSDTVNPRRLAAATVALGVALLLAAVIVGLGGGSASAAGSYPTTVFSDGFESGGLTNWNGTGGTGTVAVSAAAAHTGQDGVRMTNTAGQAGVLIKALAAPAPDSSVSFWARVGPGGGLQTLAAAKDTSSAQTMWGLLYDGTRHGLYFYPHTASGSTEIFTGAESMPVNTWTKIEVQYTATAAGGAQLLINDQTKPEWAVSGNYARTANLQRLQLWNDSTSTTDFDDVAVATPASGQPAPTVPGAPTSVQGTSGDGSVGLTWTAPASDGGSAVTGYRITPYIGATAQTPIVTTTPSASRTVTGLTNGTAYTFKVAAINAVGTGSDSAASAAVTPKAAAATAPGAPTAVQGTAGDASVALTWSAPSSDGGSAITGYRITPYVGTSAQTATVTTTAATSRTVSGLTNGTAYTFKVAAINGVGAGSDSAASAAVTPAAQPSGYSNVVFSDGFESGGLGAWDGTAGATGSVGVSAAAAHGGTNGVRMTNTAGQFGLLVKKLASPAPDSSVSFWVRVGPGGGLQTLAATKDASNSQTMWGLLYDGTRHGLYFYPHTASASTEIFTGADTVPADTWTKVEVQYTAKAAGGAQILINGQTNAGWSVSGNYARTADLQNLQLWDDTVARTDFDDVTIATPGGSSPPAPTVPGAPTAVQGTSGDASVGLTWTAPASDGGSAITGYRITPYVGSTAQTPVVTSSTATSRTVTGLTNGTAYTFKVAAINAVGTGSDSGASAAVTPAATSETAPDPPTAVQGVPGDGSVDLSWTAPAIDHGSPVHGYQIVPYIGTSAQTPIVTDTTATSRTVSGLTNGTAYTFTVAAINDIGTGPASAASAAVTPVAAPSGYGNVVFSDGFESGDLSAWDGTSGSTGSLAVSAAAAHGGTRGVRMTNTSGQFDLLVKALASPAADSSVSFWVRIGPGGGLQTLGAARDAANSQTLWGLLYDGTSHGLYFYPHTATGSTEIYTGANSVPADTWTKVEVQYTAKTSGGARLYINGQTKAAWSVSGDYTHSANLQRLQLWNDSTSTTDFDDVTVATPSAGVPPGATVPGAPTSVQGTAGDKSAALSWTAPSSDGGSAVSGYRITPFIGTTAQTPIVTTSPATSYTVTGLTNGTAYTFKVAAINAVGAGADSAASAAVTPAAGAARVPGAPTGVQGTASDRSVALSWAVPASDGGSAITGYRVTPYVGGTAQTPILTNSADPTTTVTGLTDGTAYTFTVAAINGVGTGPESAASAAVTPQAPVGNNPIAAENSLPGDPLWGDFAEPTTPAGISGYGSKISVNHGGSLDLFVTTTAASVDIDVYRMGWYNGAGARLMKSMGTFPGVNQTQALPDPTTGMIAENWSKTATLDVPSTWTTGVYLARLKVAGGYGAVIYFVVRNDGGHEPIAFQTSVNTYQAYNVYGGTSLYNNGTDKSIYSPAHATKVSFDRPFLNGDGAGQFIPYEYPFVRWAEKQGYDMSYTTDMDTHAGSAPLSNHKLFMVVGHDEYWSKAMRDSVEGAIAGGTNVAFFAGNESWWQVRMEPSASGVPNRVMVGYKDLADCTCTGGPDPVLGSDNSVLTDNWRDPRIGRPEERMMGNQFGGETNNSPYIVKNASNWIYAGTGWTEGQSIPGIVGYEYDHYFGDSDTPPNTTVLSNTPVTNTENGQPDTANATMYTAPSGATVFSAGTIQWSWGLDNFGGGSFANAGVQRVTANILARLAGL